MMNMYEEIREELKRMIVLIIDEEYNSVLKEAEESGIKLKNEVKKEDLINLIVKNTLGEPPN